MSLPRAGETSGVPLLEPLESRLMLDATIVINELLADASAPSGDWVELHNATAQPVDVGGWYLSDDADEPTRYQIPDGFILPAGGYRLLTSAGHFGTAFGLSRDGERVILSTDVLGMPVTVDEVRFGAAEEDVSFGRYVISTGGVDFVQLAGMTPGGPNAGPAIGPVVINEIMYNPPDSGDEFIELHNITDSPVRLYDPAYPDHTWTLDGAVEYTFPAGREIPAAGFVVVTEVDVSTPGAEAAFRAAHDIPGGVAVMGPYTGRLDNAGESIKVYRPGATHLVTGEYAMIRVDRVKYDDEAPWPVEADGDGPSLERNLPTAYGNDPANWHGGDEGGSPGRVNPPVVALSAEASATPTSGLTGTTVAFAGLAGGGTGAYSYSWNFGDGGTSQAQNPVYVYDTWGGHQAQLTVSDGFGQAIDTVSIVIGVAPGDANGDGKVGIADLVALADHYGMTDAEWADGDFTGDGLAGIADLAALADTYGLDETGGAGGSAPTPIGAAQPPPASAATAEEPRTGGLDPLPGGVAIAGTLLSPAPGAPAPAEADRQMLPPAAPAGLASDTQVDTELLPDILAAAQLKLPLGR